MAGLDVVRNPVAAVVVTYKPDPVVLEQVLEAAAPQVDLLVLVDNGSGPECVAQLRALAAQHGGRMLDMGANCGIAAAHNAGLQLATDAGMRQVLLLDHDSRPSEGMVAALQAALYALRAAGERVAAVGPVWVDERSGRRSVFYRMRAGRFVRIVPQPGVGPQAVDFLISSGTLLALDAVAAVGGMRDELFIDHVDTEWCARAGLAGWRMYGVPTAELRHALGDATQRVWLGRWREVALHTPLRNYYEVRNTVLLLRMSGLPWGWRIALALRLVQVLAFYMVLATPRGERVRWMARGLWDGLCGRGGPAPT